jgi:hypothetical protein
MDQSQNTAPSKHDDVALAYGLEKEAWRLQEGYCSFEDSSRLTEDAAQSLVLVEND